MAEKKATGPVGAWVERAGAVVDPALDPMRLPRRLILDTLGHARESYPEECCGLFMGPSPDPESWRPVRCSNVQSARKARGESDLDARHAFWIDERELLDALMAAENRGESLRAIYHSHIDTPAYLSRADLRGALAPDGQPLYPGSAQLVVSVGQQRIREAAWFDWDEAAAGFRGRKVDGV